MQHRRFRIYPNDSYSQLYTISDPTFEGGGVVDAASYDAVLAKLRLVASQLSHFDTAASKRAFDFLREHGPVTS